MKWRGCASVAALVLGMLLGVLPSAALPRARADIVLVPIHGTIDQGMAHLLDRSIQQAEAEHAPALVLDIDTYGGLVSAATAIRDRLLATSIPVDAYVSGRAWSAGALIALSAGSISMAPAASIGAAEPIPKTVKTVSALRAEFTATAAVRHRNATLAAAMVDVDVPAAGYKAPGTILTLTATEAAKARFVESIEPTRAAALAHWGFAGDGQRVATYTFAERIARFATDPAVSGLLLGIGFLGLLIEMQTLHLIAGALGAAALALFFGTHLYAGFSDDLVLGLAALGVVGILLELHVFPGHGVPGVLGSLALLVAIVMSFGVPFLAAATEAMAIAIVVSTSLYALSTRFIHQNAFVARLGFSGVQGRDYVASEDHTALIGKSGFALSYLRPAGFASVGGRRVDVLTEGDFVVAGTAVIVTRVEGARVFVRPEVP